MSTSVRIIDGATVEEVFAQDVVPSFAVNANNDKKESTVNFTLQEPSGSTIGMQQESKPKAFLRQMDFSLPGTTSRMSQSSPPSPLSRNRGKSNQKVDALKTPGPAKHSRNSTVGDVRRRSTARRSTIQRDRRHCKIAVLNKKK